MKVSDERNYTPSQSDIDRPLKLDIIPVSDSGFEIPEAGFSVTTGTVIPTPKEARTRRMISAGGTFNAEWLSQHFKVMNWNILADLYATEAIYPYCEKWALSWNWRKHLIIKEIKSMAADIITLQEVQKDAYDEWFKPQLAEVGYEGVYQQKKREPVFHRGKYTAEGCATFFKTTRFKRVERHVVEFDKIAGQHFSHSSTPHSSRESGEKAVQRLSKGNVALAVILEDLHIKTSHSSQATGPNGGHVICVINTHILADPEYTDVKLWQAQMLLRTLETMPIKNMPLLICGDFNSMPNSAVYELWRQGPVRSDHEDLSYDPCQILVNLPVGHQLKLSSAYEMCNGSEAQYTNYTEEFKGTLDYVWFSTETLAVLAISQVDDEPQLQQETALPSSTRPSDHISLVTTFLFRDTPHPDQQTGGYPGVASSLSNGTGGYGGDQRQKLHAGENGSLKAASGAPPYIPAFGQAMGHSGPGVWSG
jgi:CCR4-NOT transcription complex subunit 6